MPTNAAATGFWTAQQKNSAAQGRLMLQALFGNNDTTPLNGTRSGVVSTTGLTAGADLRVTVTSGLTMAVAPGVGVAHRSAEGPYEGWLKAAGSVTCDAAPGSNPRNDIVVLRMYDVAKGDTLPSVGAGSGQVATLEIITGTPNASPVDPISVNALGVYTSFPAQTGSGTGGIGIPLARAQVSTAGVITLTDLRRSTAPVGAVRFLLPGDNAATAPVRAGEMQFDPTANRLQVANTAGTWQNVQMGTVELEQASTADTTIGTSYADITGATLTFTTTVPNAVVVINADFDLRTIATGTGYCYGAVMVDGVLNTTRQSLQVFQSAESRSQAHLRIVQTLATAGSHTIKLQCKKDSAGTAVFASPTTVLGVTVYGA